MSEVNVASKFLSCFQIPMYGWVGWNKPLIVQGWEYSKLDPNATEFVPAVVSTPHMSRLYTCC